MFDVIRQLINYSGQINVDNTVLSICQILIPVFSITVIWFFAKLLSFVCGFAKK